MRPLIIILVSFWRKTKKRHVLLSLLFIPFVVQNSVAQTSGSTGAGLRKNAVYGGILPALVVNTAYVYYERMLLNKVYNQPLTIFGKIGGAGYVDWGGSDVFITSQIGMLTGSRRHHFETGLGLSVSVVKPSLFGSYVPSVNVGWRMQSSEKPFILRVGVGYPEIAYLSFGGSFGNPVTKEWTDIRGKKPASPFAVTFNPCGLLRDKYWNKGIAYSGNRMIVIEPEYFFSKRYSLKASVGIGLIRDSLIDLSDQSKIGGNARGLEAFPWTFIDSHDAAAEPELDQSEYVRHNERIDHRKNVSYQFGLIIKRFLNSSEKIFAHYASLGAYVGFADSYKTDYYIEMDTVYNMETSTIDWELTAATRTQEHNPYIFLRGELLYGLTWNLSNHFTIGMESGYSSPIFNTGSKKDVVYTRTSFESEFKPVHEHRYAFRGLAGHFIVRGLVTVKF